MRSSNLTLISTSEVVTNSGAVALPLSPPTLIMTLSLLPLAPLGFINPNGAVGFASLNPDGVRGGGGVSIAD